MHAMLDRLWYGQSRWRWLLWPLSLIYQLIVRIRRFLLQTFVQRACPVPLIVVGNLTVGGAGKTPLVIALVQAFQEKGFRVGVVTRGYGGSLKTFPHEVTADDSAHMVGDEPFLIARRCACPVVIAPRRVDAVRYLLNRHRSQIIISDDGLQHYAMGRSINIVVLDGMRGLGNGMCLPAGPLREPAGRLRQADLLVVNQGNWPGAHTMTLDTAEFIHLPSGRKAGIQEMTTPVAAVAAIGNPGRFFHTLESLGLSCIPYPFPDHHPFTAQDLNTIQGTVVMTEKDAVKCQPFAAEHWYYLPVNARLREPFWHALWSHDCLKGYFPK
ncbi:tetraacyldisaccharide 4'-kinase [Legionella sp. CNM-4043-24]|uniref:tetraacyldisaccharide 4'-kinase n=1 Tax=Legionella sp. CNM-4043-24 TaxID=3421646 RepID=UPI00403ABEEE